MTWQLEGRPLRRVLVTRLRYLGDVVMSTVVADLLKEGDPHLTVDFLCETGHGAVLEGHPSLDKVHLLGARRHGADARTRGGQGAVGRGTLGTLADLRRAKFDLAVDLFFNPRSAWLLRLAGIPERIGGPRGSRRRLYTHRVGMPESPALRDILAARVPGGLGDHVARLAPLRHGADETPFFGWLAGRSARTPLVPRLPRRRPGPAAKALLQAAGIPGDYVVVAPGATWPTKEWPAAHWQALLADLPALVQRPVAVIVPPGRMVPWLPDGSVQDLAVLPPSPLPLVLEFLGGADGLLTVDGGVMHAAVAMGVPTLALFGPTDPAIWFPYEGAGPFRVLASRPECHPCHLLECDDFVCLPQLAPAVVAEALLEILAGGAAGNRTAEPNVSQRRDQP